jgi:UDP-N-acetylmuramyl pentapeptide synthase
MIAAFKALFLQHATVIAYMLQSTEYEVGPYLKWYWRTQNFAQVTRRRVLNETRRASLLRDVLRVGMILQVALGLALVIASSRNSGYPELMYFGIALLISYPVVWAHLVVVPLLLAKWLVAGPASKQAIAESEKLFVGHGGAKIAVAGSYGKTTMKEMLATILAEGKKVAATPANKNVAISHAQFARRLSGDEEVLIIEYGEGAPGDVARFAQTTHPTHAVITGLAPAHLDKYHTLEAAARDIFSVADYILANEVFVSVDSEATRPYLRPNFHTYDHTGIKGWRVSNVDVNQAGTSFVLSKGKKKLSLHSSMLGRHQIGPLSAAAVLAMDLGLTPRQVAAGIAKTSPFPHRMQPYYIGGACIIDDTYNGNLEGIRAGTALLGELTAGRKWYVTPGLVDQGKDTARIHNEVGKLIAAANPDIVVLMKNSVTAHIQKGLAEGKFKGELRVETEPLTFYTNLEHFVSHGDVVLMQNDWTDNYA